MKSKTLIATSVAVLLATGLVAQNFVTTEFRPASWYSGTALHVQKTTDVELKNGKLYVTHSTHEACYAATIPGCKGHDKTWMNVYGASNGVVVLERTIEQVLVTRTNVTTTQTLEWPEEK